MENSSRIYGSSTWCKLKRHRIWTGPRFSCILNPTKFGHSFATVPNKTQIYESQPNKKKLGQFHLCYMCIRKLLKVYTALMAINLILLDKKYARLLPLHFHGTQAHWFWIGSISFFPFHGDFLTRSWSDNVMSENTPIQFILLGI